MDSFAVSAEVRPASVTCALVIPAFNEVETVAGVVRTAVASRLGDVLVVDDGSSDDTAGAAAAAGAEVLRLGENRGKGGALSAAANRLDADVLVLIDADLIGLTPEHLHDLAAPVLAGEVDMTRGVFVGGRWRTSAAQRIVPQLNGQRAVRRRLLLGVPGLADSRYGVEVAITEYARAQGWRRRDVPLVGVTQVMKEEKLGLWRGLRRRLVMYRDIVATLLQRRGAG